MIHIEHLTFNSLKTRSVLIWDNDGHCAFADPGFQSSVEKEKLLSLVESKGLRPECIMLTHGHFDHIYGVAELLREYDIPVYIHPNEISTIEKVNPLLCKAFGLPLPEMKAGADGKNIVFIKEGDIIKVGSLRFEVIETPGHTSGGVCFLERNEKLLLSGDTLFAGAIGRTDHPEGDYAKLMKSIFEKLMVLDGDIDVIPGHGPATSIAEERMTNPFLMPFNEPYED